MKKIRTWQLCRTGTFGADGAAITEQDLREIQETFVPPRPVSIGHEAARRDNFPKFGDVLSVDGIYPDAGHPGEKVLVGRVILHPELDRQFDDAGDGSGTYEGWSVTIPRRASDGKRYLHSLAVTGAVPPKIPGLEQLMVQSAFCDGDRVEAVSFSDKIEFQEESMTDEEKKRLEELEAENKRLKEDAAAKSKEFAEEKKKEDEEAERKKSEYAELAKRCDMLERDARDARVKGVADRFSGRVPAGILPKIAAVAEKLAAAGNCEFSDDGKSESVPALDMFSDILDGLASSAKNDVTEQRFRAEEFSDRESGGKDVDWNKLAANM